MRDQQKAKITCPTNKRKLKMNSADGLPLVQDEVGVEEEEEEEHSVLYKNVKNFLQQ